MADEVYAGKTKEDFNEEHNKATIIESSKRKRKNKSGNVNVEEEPVTSKEDKEEVSFEISNKVHEKLQDGQKAYSKASVAPNYPENTFVFSLGRYFVDQHTNYYIYDKGSVVRTFGSNPVEKYNGKLGLKGENTKEGIAKAESFRRNYRYSAEIKVKQIKRKLEVLAHKSGLKENAENALFLAAMIAEPARNTVASITQLLAINNPQNQDKPAFSSTDRALSMPAGGTDQEPSEGNYDSNLYQNNQDWKKHNSDVTTIDLNSVKNYPGLMDDIVLNYEEIMKSESDEVSKDKRAKVMMKKEIINKLNIIPNYD